MAIISFENLVLDGRNMADVPDGYRNLNWSKFGAVEGAHYPNSGWDNVVHSETAAGFNELLYKPVGFRSPDRHDDFDLNSGYFAAAFTTDLTVTVDGFDNGKKVATKVLLLDQDRELVRFGPQFDDIDKVTFTASGGTDVPGDGIRDVGPPFTYFGVDDLFIV